MHSEAFAYIKRWFRPEQGDRVLEVGAFDVNSTAQGLILRDLPAAYGIAGVQWLGIDIREGPGVDLVVEAGKAWPFEGGSFQWTLMLEMLEHDANPRETLAEVARVLPVGGKAIITTAAGARKHHAPPHFWNFWPEGIYMFLTEQNFTVRHLELREDDLYAFGIKSP